jgi:hypothetical protein
MPAWVWRGIVHVLVVFNGPGGYSAADVARNRNTQPGCRWSGGGASEGYLAALFSEESAD